MFNNILILLSYSYNYTLIFADGSKNIKINLKKYEY